MIFCLELYKSFWKYTTYTKYGNRSSFLLKKNNTNQWQSFVVTPNKNNWNLADRRQCDNERDNENKTRKNVQYL